jgi:5'-3' exonuclease
VSSKDSRETTLLLDGDVLAFKVAAGVQKIEEDDFGYIRPFANVVEGMASLDNLILKLTAELDATHIRVVLSDAEANWRKEIYPDYKSERGDKTRPLLLARLKDYLRTNYGAVTWPSLEADDVLGIWATEPQPYPGRRIVVGQDKDFKCIPGLHFTLGDYGPAGPVLREVTPQSAMFFHLQQTLAGDRIDGYPGCPGIGMERASQILSEPKLLVPQKGVVTRGERKGQSTTKWMGEPTTDLWACVVSNYRKAGLKEEDALRTARLARILLHEDYDRENERIILWTPDKLRA